MMNDEKGYYELTSFRCCIALILAGPEGFEREKPSKDSNTHEKAMFYIVIDKAKTWFVQTHF